MKKNLIKIILLFAIFLLTRYVYADTNDSRLIKNRYDNIYAVYDAPDKVHLYYAQKYTLNDITAYCIEPGLPIDTEIYSSTTDWNITNLSNEVRNYVRLIAYYGYDYPGHNTMEYYLAAQELIWRKIAGRGVYWIRGTDTDGPVINVDNEKNEIQRLANEHTKAPSFDNQTIEVLLGEIKTITDDNNVLSNYEIYSSDVDAKIDDNNLVMNITNPKRDAEIKLIRKHYTNSVALIYFSGANQKLVRSGILDPVIATSKLKITIKAKVKVIKTDLMYKNTIRRKGIKFKIKNLDTKEYVCENTNCIYETDDTGSFVTSLLDVGNYKVEELEDQDLYGYLWNSGGYKFTIDDNSEFIYENNEPIIEIKFTNRQVKGRFRFNKIGEKIVIKDNKLTYEEIPLGNVYYKLYANEDIYSADGILKYKDKQFIKYVMTDNKGNYLLMDMYLGKYCLEETATVLNHILDKNPYCFEINYKDKYTDNIMHQFTLKNYLAKGNFELTKLDLSTDQPIEGTKIEIYTENGELIYTGITNKDGKIYMSGIPLGRYYFKEIEASEGYLLNEDNHYFEIKENGEIVRSTLTNERITGTFDFTKIDYSTGESLPNTLIEIYNINNELLYSERTNEEGKIIIDKLPYGKYYFIEKEAPIGYMLNEERMYFQILENNEVVKANMANEKIKVPNTNLNENYLIYIISIICLVLGGILFIYEKKYKE